MRNKSDELIEGAIDLHCHCYPEFSSMFKSRLDDLETVQAAQKAGMQGLVFKSHFWPTVGRVDYLRHLVPEVQVFGSISLNISAGGLSPWAVESAAVQGAKVVWMPTWSSSLSLQKAGGVGKIMKKYVPLLNDVGPAHGLSILDESGMVLDNVKEILAVGKKYNLVVSTGHLYPEESLQLAAAASELGFTKLVFGHPLANSISAGMGVIQEMANRNSYIELSALNALFQAGNGLDRTVEVIREVGAEKCILTSDSFGTRVPPPAEMLRMFVGALLDAGIEEEAFHHLLKINPSKLLDL